MFFLFAIPMWLKVVWFALVNLPDIIRLIREIRQLNSDLPKEEQRAYLDELKADIDEYNKTKDEGTLRARLQARRDKIKRRREARDKARSGS